MQFDHHNMTGVRLAVALVNLPEPWTPEALADVLAKNWFGEVDPGPAVLTGLHRLVSRLRPVFDAEEPAARCEAVNALLADGTSPVLTMHDGLPPHLHFAAGEDEVVQRLSAFMAGSLAMFTVEAAGRRLGTCARRACSHVFVDTSLNGRRAYCSARCANSDAVERHRERKRARLPA